MMDVTQVNASSPLSERLRELIRNEGQITFHDWMNAALYDRLDGYYNRPKLERWGRQGDYRTSPERSELFAATFARYFATLYDSLARPAEWVLVEAGAGDGSFAVGVLKTLRDYFPECFAATSYYANDVSDDANARARKRLEDFANKVRFCALSELPNLNPGVVFSNELFDAFPVHRLTRLHGELSEFYVSVNAKADFVWSVGALSDSRLMQFCENNGIEVNEGQIVEVNLEIEPWLVQVASKLERGYVITVDYGDAATALYSSPERRQGTLRGFSRHTFVEDILSAPGEYDLKTTIARSL